MLNLLRLFLLAAALLMAHNVTAMKRKCDFDVEKSETNKTQRREEKLGVLSTLPPEIVEIILANLTLHDLSFSFVNRECYEKAQILFEDFYQFQKTYHTHKLCNNSLDILKKLRKAELFLTKNGRSVIEKKALLGAFFKRNFNLIKETLVNPEYSKNSDRLIQVALMGMLDHEGFILLLNYEQSLTKYYENSNLKLVAPSHILAHYFSIENNFDFKCDLASELCQRGFDQAKVVVGEAFNRYYLANAWECAAELYERALPHSYDWLAEDYLYAAFSNYKFGMWRRAANLYDIALQKEPTLATLNYLNAAHAHLKLGEQQKAINFCRIARDRDPLCTHDSFSIETLINTF